MIKFLCLFLAVVTGSVTAMSREEAFQLLLVSSHQGQPTLQHFEAFKLYYGKSYRNAFEEAYRFLQFKENMWQAKLDQDDEMGTAIHGATKISDLSPAEKKRYHSLKVDTVALSSLPKALIPQAAAASVDWRKQGAVTGVKDQGQCGSCWAFSTTGNIEGQWFLKKGALISLSEQELVDCDHNGDEGCDGGLPSQAYDAIVKLGGLERESDYKYTAEDGSCKFDKTKVAVTISGGISISTDESDMASWCAANGPLSIALNAANMESYISGIAHPRKRRCSSNDIDHAVLIVGYDTASDGTPFWIVKNSWGTDWGEDGYWRVYRGDGTCGLNCCSTSSTV